MNNTFTWWLFNLGVTLVLLAIAVKSESWLVALVAAVYLAIAFVIDLPKTSSTETPDDEQDEDWFG